MASSWFFFFYAHNKIIFAFCNFAHVPKNNQQYLYFWRLSMRFFESVRACAYLLCTFSFAWESYCRHEVWSASVLKEHNFQKAQISEWDSFCSYVSFCGTSLILQRPWVSIHDRHFFSHCSPLPMCGSVISRMSCRSWWQQLVIFGRVKDGRLANVA